MVEIEARQRVLFGALTSVLIKKVKRRALRSVFAARCS